MDICSPTTLPKRCQKKVSGRDYSLPRINPFPMYGLIIEDDSRLAKHLQGFLKNHGFCFDVCSSKDAALRSIKHNLYGLVLLDLKLPDGYGLDLIPPIREQSPDCHISVISAIQRPEIAAASFDANADNYFRKPLCHFELLAYLKQLIRKRANAPPPRSFAFQGITFCLEGSTVEAGGEVITLTPKERLILLCLLQHRPRPASYNTLIDCLWESSEGFVDMNLLHKHMSRLRRKLKQLSSQKLIINCPQLGYKLHDES